MLEWKVPISSQSGMAHVILTDSKLSLVSTLCQTMSVNPKVASPPKGKFCKTCAKCVEYWKLEVTTRQ